MLTVLALAIALAIVTSFFCSLLEAALYAVPLPHVNYLKETGSKAGEILYRFKEDMSQPIEAILILNTISNTAGAAVAGAQVSALWGEQGLVVFSILFTLAVLFISEISPKILGVAYCKSISRYAAYPLRFAITVLTPIIIITQMFSRFFRRTDGLPSISEEEVLSIAAMGTEEGTLDRFEGSVIENVIGLDRILVRDVLTPRVNVFRLADNTPLTKVKQEIATWKYTRVPLFVEDDPEHLVSYVIQRDVYRELMGKGMAKTLKDIARPLHVVPELMPADKLLMHMFERREHIVSVVDEHGALAGIITLEDVLEELVGREIVDEYDESEDG